MPQPPALRVTDPSPTPFPTPGLADDSRRAASPGRDLSPAQLARLVRATAAATAQWQPFVRFTSQRRLFHRLALTDDYETWLLTWLPGQRTGFHDHGGASGAFAVVAGNLRETRAKPATSRLRHRSARKGSVTSFGGQYVHEVANVGHIPAISLHAYSPPLSAMRQYELTGSGLTLVRTDLAELGW